MKITGIETFLVDGGWRPWIFMKVTTDEGITGYGECSDTRSPMGILGAVEDLKPVLIGSDPRAYEMRFWDMYRIMRQSPGGLAAKAIAGIECALVDHQGQGAWDLGGRAVRRAYARQRPALLVALRNGARPHARAAGRAAAQDYGRHPRPGAAKW